MKTHAQVVVIGGGVIGCSILYHLAKRGCKDAVLLERSELTSGSTWHAAAGTHVLHDIPNLSRLHRYTINLYPQLEAETGQSCGIHRVGGVYIATQRERLDQLKIQRSKARYLGIEFEFIERSELQELHPLLNTEGVLGAMYEPNECHVDPSGVTHAYAKGARMHGAEIYRFCPVLETQAQADGSWLVVTPQGTIRAEKVVNAAGLWAREVAALAGIHLPLAPMEHQYFVTEAIAEVQGLDHELPLLHDNDGEYYLRQEGQGLLVGTYEADARFWAEQGTPLDFGHELLPDDLERIMDNVARAMERVPCLSEAGIKRIINGPMIWTPDVQLLLGPVPELKNYYTAAGMIPGFSQGGGIGMMLAEWILDGQPSLDLFPLDVARFGDYAGKTYTMARAAENYSSRFRIYFPYEECQGGRPAKTRPIYEQQCRQGAVFGAAFGWEYPLWFAPDGMEAKDELSFRRGNWFEPVAEECRALRSQVGLLDISHFGKLMVSGAGAEDWLNRLLTNRMPVGLGRTVLSPMANEQGGVVGEFTVTKLAEEQYLLLGSGLAERYYQRWFNRFLPAAGVTLNSLTAAWAGFAIAGPRSRELLAALSGADVSNTALPFLRSQALNLGPAIGRVIRISFSGELGYELYFPVEYQYALYQEILRLGTDFGLRLVGSRALHSLRLEKSYGSWGTRVLSGIFAF